MERQGKNKIRKWEPFSPLETWGVNLIIESFQRLEKSRDLLIKGLGTRVGVPSDFLHYDRTILSFRRLYMSHLGHMAEDVIVFSDLSASPQFYGSHPAHCQHSERHVTFRVIISTWQASHLVFDTRVE